MAEEEPIVEEEPFVEEEELAFEEEPLREETPVETPAKKARTPSAKKSGRKSTTGKKGQ
jgi:hypothetical protein